MTNSEKIKLLSGTKDERVQLMNYLLDKTASGQQLDSTEIPMLVYLKEDLLDSQPVVIADMSASMTGAGGLL